MCVNGNVRSECNRYAVIVFRSVLRGQIMPSRTLFRIRAYTSVSGHSTRQHTGQISGPKGADEQKCKPTLFAFL